MEDAITEADYLAKTTEIEQEQEEAAGMMAVDSPVPATKESAKEDMAEGKDAETPSRPAGRVKRKMGGDDDEMELVISTTGAEDHAGEGLEAGGTGRRGPRVPMMTVPRRGLVKPLRRFVDVKGPVSGIRIAYYVVLPLV